MTTVKLPFVRPLRPSLSLRLMFIGLGMTGAFILIAVFAPLLQAIALLQDPTDLLSNLPLEAPSWGHWFGTNVRGYDVFSRTLFGTQAALQVVILAPSFSVFITPFYS